MTLDDALEMDPVPGIYLDVDAMCVSVGGPIDEALNTLSLDLARRYFDGKVTYTVADAVINNIWWYCTKWIFTSSPARSVPRSSVEGCRNGRCKAHGLVVHTRAKWKDHGSTR